MIDSPAHAHLYLVFVSSKFPELAELRFWNPLTAEERLFMRGRVGMLAPGIHGFQWTAGIQAFCLLAVRTALVARDEGPLDAAVLRGGRGSLAFSLEYAVGKKCAWLLDLFGVSARGEALLYRYLRRVNPGAKREGDVLVAINQELLPGMRIHCCVGGIELLTAAQLRELAERIESRLQAQAEQILAAAPIE